MQFERFTESMVGTIIAVTGVLLALVNFVAGLQLIGVVRFIDIAYGRAALAHRSNGFLTLALFAVLGVLLALDSGWTSLHVIIWGVGVVLYAGKITIISFVRHSLAVYFGTGLFLTWIATAALIVF